MIFSITRGTLLFAALLAAQVAAGEPQLQALDRSFGENGDGRQIIDSAYKNADASALAVDGQNRLLLAGYASDGDNKIHAAVTRLNAQGRLDEDYAHSLASLPAEGYDAYFLGIAAYIHGAAVAAGSWRAFEGPGPCTDLADCWYVCKLTPAGAYESAFGDETSPGCTSPLGGLPGSAQTVVLQDDGRILAAGYIIAALKPRAAILRFEPDGDLDVDFGDNGIALLPDQFYSVSLFNAMHLAADGTIAAAGLYQGSEQHMLVARFDATGKSLPSFSGGARVVPFTQVPTEDQSSRATFVHVLNDGSVLLGGTTRTAATDGINSRPALVKLDANGIGVEEFGMPGLLAGQRIIDPCETPPCKFDASMFYMADGSVEVAGEVTYSQYDIKKAYAMRVLPNGEIDPAFADGDGTFAPGVATAWWPEADFTATAMQQGRVVLAGAVEDEGEKKLAAIRFRNSVLFADGFDGN